jgi:Uma2 family endonuclease
MKEIGVLPERYELLDGDIVSKMGQGIPHRQGVSHLFDWLLEGWDADHVQTQAPVDVAPAENLTNEPEPDLAALNRPLSSLTSNPGPGVVELIIEVSDSSLTDDLTRKRNLYARAGFPEYWVYDVKRRRLLIHRTPVDGEYRDLLERTGAMEIAPLARPDLKIRPDQIL